LKDGEVQEVEYSYSQYHWCATTLTVTDGEESSSIKYKIYREGNAIKSKIIIGITVHTVSSKWESMVYLSEREVMRM